MTPMEPLSQHLWLQQLVGEWTFEHDCSPGPDQPAMKTTGRDTVRSFGGLWIFCEGQAEIPEGGTMFSLMTLGFDPTKNKFVGTFHATVMPNLWVYEGELDAERKVLTLDTVGPSFTDPNRTTKYKDVIELVNPNLRMLSSHALGDDGQWMQFMSATYRRN